MLNYEKRYFLDNDFPLRYPFRRKYALFLEGTMIKKPQSVKKQYFFLSGFMVGSFAKVAKELFFLVISALVLVLTVQVSFAETLVVSVASDGGRANHASYGPSLSADGRYVAFKSYASNLVPGDINSQEDVFVRDLQTSSTTCISVSMDGTPVGGAAPSISADGRYVAFSSYASNLVADDTIWWAPDIFVRDLQSGTTTRVSVSSDGSESNGGSYEPSISADGRYVAFLSSADNLVENDTNELEDVFVHDCLTGETRRASLASDGTQSNRYLYSPSISADGRFVAFATASSNLVLNDTNNALDIFVHDLQTGSTTLVSLGVDGNPANDNSFDPSISAAGRYVAFSSDASNLVSGDTNYWRDIFVRDLWSGTTTRVSVASDGSEANSGSESPSISADGRYVAFSSGARNLVANDTSGYEDVFIHDLQTGSTTLVSIASDGTRANDSSWGQSIAPDGRSVAFTSGADNLVNNYYGYNMFIHKREPFISAVKNVQLGVAAVNTLSSPKKITIVNKGTLDLNLGILSLTGADASEFLISNDSCSGGSISPFLYCSVELSFTSSIEGLKTATLLVPSNDPDSPLLSIEIEGSAVTDMGSAHDASALKWSKTTISKNVWDNGAIAVDSQGHAHISYMDASNSGYYALKHAYYNGSSWQTETVDSGNVGWYSSIAIDSQDHIHISYHADGPLPDGPLLKYAYFDGVQWHITTVDSGGYSTSIAVDENDHPHITHIDDDSLKYVRYDGSSWISEAIDDNAVSFGGTSLALSSSGNAHIAFSTWTFYRDLFYATNASGSWEVQQVGSGLWSSLALDSSETPHIVYSGVNFSVKYSVYNGLEWVTEDFPCDSRTGLCPEYPGIAIDAHDNVHLLISYDKLMPHNTMAGFIMYFRLDANGWSNKLVEARYSVSPFLALDRLGLPHAIYLQPGKDEYSILKYAYIAAPDLSGEALGFSIVTRKGKETLNGQLTIENEGTLSAKKCAIAFYSSDDDTLDATDAVIGKTVKVKGLSPGHAKPVSFSIPYTAAMSGKYLVAVIDSQGVVSEPNEGNNIILVGRMP